MSTIEEPGNDEQLGAEGMAVAQAEVQAGAQASVAEDEAVAKAEPVEDPGDDAATVPPDPDEAHAEHHTLEPDEPLSYEG